MVSSADGDCQLTLATPPLGRRFEGLLVAGVTFCLFLFFASRVPLGWDEGYTFDRLERLRPWFARLLDPNTPNRASLFHAEALERSWPFSREEPDGHGPFYALLALAGESISLGRLPPPLCFRLGAVLLLSVTTGVIYSTFARKWGRSPALAAVGLLIISPRLLPEFCFALTDGPLVCLSLLAWCAFVRGLERPGWGIGIVFGAIVGAAMADKFTGWFLPIPYLAWSVSARSRRGWYLLLVGAIAAVVTVFVINVGWWPDPLTGIERFFRSNLTRAATRPIPIWFLGSRYDFSLPWYNTLVWTVVATPMWTLLLGGLGMVVAFLRRSAESVAWLLVLNWGCIMVVRALPQAPGHDGTRQLAVSFAFLPLLAGYGLAILREQAARRIGRRQARLVCGFVAGLAIAESAVGVAATFPTCLSYYSPVIGGLRGAERLGLEPTYFWDSFTPEVANFLNEHTAPDEWVLFCHNPTNWDWLERWGELQARHRPTATGATPRWYVLQHRTGLYSPADRWLLAHCKPAFEQRLQGVALLSIFDGTDWLTSRNASWDGRR